jgi:colanic acid/amylovoran biosynthesis glycosyltransferase
MGLITIATDHSGNSELINHGVHGFLVPERNVAAIVKAVEYLCNNPGAWIPIQKAAAKKVQQEFDKEKENKKLERILYALLEAS